jgi:hypothetical protein
MNADQLAAAWQELRTPDTAEQLEAFPLAPGGVWAAVDHEGHRHLLLEVPDGTEAPPTTTRGLQATVTRHKVADAAPASYLDLRCLSADVVPTFTAVAADIASTAGELPPPTRLQDVVAALARWQWFWGVDAERLSQQDVLGLFGELWFLHRWAGPNAGNVRAWTASMGSRHDFQWSQWSVEVKTATRRPDGAILHRIQHLDQLADPEQGRLFLFSLRVVQDQLAHNSLPGLVDRVSDALRGDIAAGEEFARRLGQRGYSPAHRRHYDTPWRILGEQLYSVATGFPRLIDASFVDGLPDGVSDVSYRLDMAVCQPWLVATTPDGWPPK